MKLSPHDLERQLRDEKERHKDTLEAIERDREMVRVVLDLEQQFLTESRVKDLERQLVAETRVKTSEANGEDAPGGAPISILGKSQSFRGR